MADQAVAIVPARHPRDCGWPTTWAKLPDLTLSIAADYATENIRANCTPLGIVNMPMISQLGSEALQRRRKAVPLRIEGTGCDIGHAAVNLVSDEARWVTWAMLPIDGGFAEVCQRAPSDRQELPGICASVFRCLRFPK
jgi:NAD(P)-dependent dehydrogenase (short-subunit alcohol dehydrogenase family)